MTESTTLQKFLKGLTPLAVVGLAEITGAWILMDRDLVDVRMSMASQLASVSDAQGMEAEIDGIVDALRTATKDVTVASTGRILPPGMTAEQLEQASPVLSSHHSLVFKAKSGLPETERLETYASRLNFKIAALNRAAAALVEWEKAAAAHDTYVGIDAQEVVEESLEDAARMSRAPREDVALATP